MKKLSCILAAAAVVMATAGCEKISDIIHGVNETEQGLVDDKGKDLTPDQQKVKIEETANTLMTLMDKSQWETEYEKVNATIKAMDKKELDGQDIEDYLESIIKAWTLDSDPNEVAKTVAHLTDIKGHFTENSEGKFDFTEADDLAITVFEGDIPVTATFSAKDESKTPYHYSDSDEDVTVYIPGVCNLSIAKNNEVLGSLTINLKPVDLNGDGVITEREDKVDISYTITVGPYTFKLSQADFASDKASAKASISKGKQLIVGVELATSYRYINEIQHIDDQYGGYDLHYEEIMPLTVEGMVDLAGKMQIRFNMPDGDKLKEAMEKMDSQNEEAFKASLAEIEKLYGIGVYYDGKKTLQATLGFEPLYNKEMNYWTANPVIRFADGTSYAVTDYFTEDRFGDLQQSIIDWINELYSYLGINTQTN